MQALDGIRVLDLTFNAPGSYCTMILADMGAEVIKIEAPSNVPLISSTRSPEKGGGAGEKTFQPMNRGKKSIVLNLKAAGALPLFRKLAKTSDVVIEGFRPGVAERLGVGPKATLRANRRIVYCSLSGYGQDGPYRGLGGHDVNYISVSGALDLIGEYGGAPVIPQNLLGDFAGGSLFAVIGILSALMARGKTGKGQYIDMSITDGVMSLLTAQAAQYLATGRMPARGATAYGGAYPYYGVYQTKDKKFISIGCLEAKFWENLCKVIDKDEYAAYTFDIRSHLGSRPSGKKWAEIRRSLEEVFLQRSSEEWFSILSRADVPVAKVNSIDEGFEDPHLIHRKMVIEVGVGRQEGAKQVGTAIKLSDTPCEVKGFSPLLGEHTEEIIRSVGYSDQQIRRMRQSGVVC